MIRSRRIKNLESDLQQISSFISPNVALEQYQTPPRLAAEILFAIDSYGEDIEGKVVLDLGCGTGILGLGCVRLGASRVIGVEIDPAAVKVAQENVRDVGLSSEDIISFINKDVRHLDSVDIPLKHIDFVVMNPPFGTKHDVHMDYAFIQKGFQFADKIFSLHKSATRDFWQKKVHWKVKVLNFDIQFPIDEVLKFHKKNVEFTYVDLICHFRDTKHH